MPKITKRKSEEPKSEAKKEDLLGQKHLFTYERKLKKIKKLKLNEMLLRREELEMRKKDIDNSKQQQNQMFEYLQTQNSQ